MKLLHLSLLFLFSLQLSAQNDKTIEVLVRDTIHIKGKEFIYSLVIQPTPTNNSGFGGLKEKFMENPQNSSADSKSITQEEFNHLVKTNQLEIVESEGSNFMINHLEIEGEMINIKFDSKESLSQFVEGIEKYTNVYGYISHIELGETSAHETRLIQKIIQKAKIRAAIITNSMEKEIGEILAISEEQYETTSSHSPSFLQQNLGWSAFPPIANLKKLMTPEMKTSMIKTFSFRVRFELK